MSRDKLTNRRFISRSPLEIESIKQLPWTQRESSSWLVIRKGVNFLISL